MPLPACFPELWSCRAETFPEDSARAERVAAAGHGGFAHIVQDVLPPFIQSEATPPAGQERLLPPGQALPDWTVPIGIGAGVFFREAGYTPTNNQVGQDAERVLLVLHDRPHFEAVVVGSDPSAWSQRSEWRKPGLRPHASETRIGWLWENGPS